MLQLKMPLSSESVCVGIDVAKAKFDVLIDNGKKPFTVLNTPGGRSKLIRRIAGLPLASIVVESSGLRRAQSSRGYERELLFDLLDARLPDFGELSRAVAHVNPRVVRDYAKSFNQLANPSTALRTIRWMRACWRVTGVSVSHA